MATVRDEILDDTQGWVPVFSARKILKKYFNNAVVDCRSSALTFEESHSKH